MTTKPRIHHFVPQFWIKKFASSNGKIEAFDKKDGQVYVRSARQIMQLYNLYTLQPTGIDDTTLETSELNKIDSDGAALGRFNRPSQRFSHTAL
jgi:hypothetical protein